MKKLICFLLCMVLAIPAAAASGESAQIIDIVEFTRIQVPGSGTTAGNAAPVFTVPSGSPYSVVAGSWTWTEKDYTTPLDSGTVFQFGDTRYGTVKVQAADGYELTEDTRTDVIEECDGNPLFVEPVEGSNGKYALVETIIYFNTPAGTVSQVNLTVTLPTAGKAAGWGPAVSVPSGLHYEYVPQDSPWLKDENDRDVFETTVLEAGKTYSAGLRFKATDGFAFADNVKCSVTNARLDEETAPSLNKLKTTLDIIVYITIPQSYKVTVTNDGNGTAGAEPASAASGTEIKLTASPKSGYRFKEWQVISGGVTVKENKFILGAANVEIKAVFEAEPATPGKTDTTPITPEKTDPKPETQPGTQPKPQEPAKAPAGEYTDPAAGTVIVDDSGNATFKAPAGNKASVVIPDTVTVNGVEAPITKIADGAFKKNKKLTTVSIGSNVKTIGAGAFSSCAKLKTIKGGSQVQEIGKNAFASSKKLKTVPNMPNLKKIGDSAFKGCVSLTKVTIGAEVTSIGKSAFGGCSKLKTVTIKSTKLTKKNVKSGAFKGIPDNATVKCPKSVKKAYAKWLPKKGLPKTAKIK